jgi:hypothetical protein
MLRVAIDRENNEVGFTFVKDGAKSGNYNVKNDQYNFVFNGVMDMLSQQETVFDTVAKDVSTQIFKLNLIGHRVLLRWIQWNYIRLWIDRFRKDLLDHWWC